MEKSRLLSVISKLREVAKREGWKPLYDKELDSFYWTKPVISKNAILTQFIKDFSLYITPDENVEGLFIEYALHNFQEHNRSYQPLFEAMTKKIDGNFYTVDEGSDGTVSILLDDMAGKVASETLGAIANGFSINEILPQGQAA